MTPLAAADLRQRLAALAALEPAPAPVVSVYLDTRWVDEQQRDRVRVFLKNELRRARQEAGDGAAGDLGWIEDQGRLLVEQARDTEASGVALFACSAIGLREVWPLRLALENTLVVADRPWLRPLAAVLDQARPALVVFVDGESARLIPLEPGGAGQEVTLQSDVEGRHAMGGWAALAQSRYQRHIEAHRHQHLEAVADALRHLADQHRVERIVLAGEPRTVGLLRPHLPGPLAARVVGEVAGTRWEPAAALAARAAGFLERWEQSDTAEDLDAVLDDAAAGARAAAGLGPTLEAVRRNNALRLYVLDGFQAPGRRCRRCATVEPGEGGPCPACGGPTRPVELGEALVELVIAAGGTAETVATHAGLARAGGIAARLRY